MEPGSRTQMAGETARALLKGSLPALRQSGRVSARTVRSSDAGDVGDEEVDGVAVEALGVAASAD